MIAILRKQTVYNLFKEYFGEDKVDMQDNTILVWWPELTVSNEEGESCIIKDLYAKIHIENNGALSGGFTLNRTSYSLLQWECGYCHSHVRPLPIIKSTTVIKQWREPCLGQGPIRETISNLNSSFDELAWRLFIYELDQYVRHESLEGVPYIKLRTIGTRNEIKKVWNIPIAVTEGIKLAGYDGEILDKVKRELTKEIIRVKPFRFNFINNCYGIAENPLDIVLKVSNIFIDWYNTVPSAEEQAAIIEMLRNRWYFKKCKIVNNKIEIIERTSSRAPDTSLEGMPVLRFKGETRLLNIYNKEEGLQEAEENVVQLLHPKLIQYIIHRILRTVNYKFKNDADEESTPRIEETVRYF